MTQPAFAQAFEITVAQQKSYEGGKAKPDIVYMERLSKLVNISPDNLIKQSFTIEELRTGLDLAEYAEKERTAKALRAIDTKKEKPGSFDYQAEFSEAMKTIRGYNDFLQDMLKSSLGKLLEDQTGASALIGVLLRRDIDREANGNPEKEQEILNKILQKIGPKLNSDAKEGIGADGRK